MKTSFTIIELIFVIVIIGVLASIALPRYEEVQDDALAAVEKATIGEARHSVLSFHGWRLLHPGDKNKTVKIASKDGGSYECDIIFSSYGYPISVTTKEASDGIHTDNNISVGTHTEIGEYRTLAPLMLDPPTIKDFNSTKENNNQEYINGPATNSVTYENAELKKGMYWIYDNRNGYFLLKK